MKTPFEPTKSFCYKVARYELLDQIAQEPEALSGLPFKMIEVTKRVIERNFTSDQLEIEIPAEQANRVDTVFGSIKFFLQLHAKRLANSPFIWLGEGGMYKLKADADIAQEIEEAELEEVDDEGNEIEFDGWVYAFSFPMLVKTSGVAFPIKIGLTTQDVEKRVASQCGTAAFENPVILGRWQVNRVKSIEATIHSLLKSRGKWRDNVPGTEWFNTTLTEIESIIQFIQQS